MSRATIKAPPSTRPTGPGRHTERHATKAQQLSPVHSTYRTTSHNSLLCTRHTGRRAKSTTSVLSTHHHSPTHHMQTPETGNKITSGGSSVPNRVQSPLLPRQLLQVSPCTLLYPHRLPLDSFSRPPQSRYLFFSFWTSANDRPSGTFPTIRHQP